MTSAPAAPFGRVLTAMVTAFHDDGSVDLDGTARIAAHLVDHGHDGVVVSGTTGESPTTSVAEDGQILRAVKDAVGDRATVVAGVGTNATAHSVELARQAEKIGADGLLLVTPYYNKPGQAGVAAPLPHGRRRHRRPGDALRRPGPHRHHRSRSRPSTAAIERRHRRRGQGRRRRLRPRRPAHARLGYAVYSGDDASNLGWLAHGGCGFVSVVGHVAGDQLRRWSTPTSPATSTGALEIFTRLLPAIDAIMGVANYGATTAKAALQLLGVLDNRNVRGPLVPLDDDEVAALRDGLAAAGLLQT